MLFKFKKTKFFHVQTTTFACLLAFCKLQLHYEKYENFITAYDGNDIGELNEYYIICDFDTVIYKVSDLMTIVSC